MEKKVSAVLTHEDTFLADGVGTRYNEQVRVFVHGVPDQVHSESDHVFLGRERVRGITVTIATNENGNSFRLPKVAKDQSV